MPILIDSHEDLAYNMLSFGRDYTRSALETRQVEKDTTTPERNGDTLLGYPEYQQGQVAVVFSTLFISPRRFQMGEWETQAYSKPNEAYPLHRAQIDQYYRLCGTHPEKFQLIRTRQDLTEVLKPWDAKPADYPNTTHPVGLVMLMEGAEGLQRLNDLEEWWEAGIRIIGPVWAGTRFCGGTLDGHTFTSEGFELLDTMAGLGFTLDISHMNETSALQALERYPGHIIASHANARAVLKDDPRGRHLTDAVIRALFERGGTIGVIPYNRFLKAGWTINDNRQSVPLDLVVAQIDYLCQMAGNAHHTGIGSDFDGGFGYPAVPYELSTIADLQKLEPLLHDRGYSPADIAAIFGLNWRTFLEETLPQR
jgi:membrane dipeptidase